MNPLDFIDCKAVREYNRDRLFTPMEQALIIFYSNQPVDSKLAAWRELLNRYDDAEFIPPYRLKDGRSNKQLIADTVSAFESALSYRHHAVNAVFKAAFYEKDYPNSVDETLFSTYDYAFEYIRKCKHEYLDDEFLKNVAVMSEIEISQLDAVNSSRTVFRFDNELRLVNILTDAFDSVTSELDNFFLYLPLPYKKGDILKTTYNGKKWYGVVSHDPDDAYFSHVFPDGDSSDMNIGLCFYDSSDNSFDADNIGFLYLDECRDDELPEDQKILMLLREVYLGAIDLSSFLFLYSRYGKDAHSVMYGQSSSGSEVGK